jgi:hypothetical protein
MVNLSKLSQDELRATDFKNVSTARNYIKDILKTKAQKFKKVELINKLTSEFNKFRNFGIDLNRKHIQTKGTNINRKHTKPKIYSNKMNKYYMI